MKAFGELLDTIGKKRSIPFADKIDGKMVEKFIFLNLSHLPCMINRKGNGVCDEVITEFGAYLESKGVGVSDAIGIFQLLTLLTQGGIKAVEKMEDKLKQEEEKPTEVEETSDYKPKFPI